MLLSREVRLLMYSFINYLEDQEHTLFLKITSHNMFHRGPSRETDAHAMNNLPETPPSMKTPATDGAIFYLDLGLRFCLTASII